MRVVDCLGLETAAAPEPVFCGIQPGEKLRGEVVDEGTADAASRAEIRVQQSATDSKKGRSAPDRIAKNLKDLRGSVSAGDPISH